MTTRHPLAALAIALLLSLLSVVAQSQTIYDTDTVAISFDTARDVELATNDPAILTLALGTGGLTGVWTVWCTQCDSAIMQLSVVAKPNSPGTITGAAYPLYTTTSTTWTDTGLQGVQLDVNVTGIIDGQDVGLTARALRVAFNVQSSGGFGDVLYVAQLPDPAVYYSPRPMIYATAIDTSFTPTMSLKYTSGWAGPFGASDQGVTSLPLYQYTSEAFERVTSGVMVLLANYVAPLNSITNSIDISIAPGQTFDATFLPDSYALRLVYNGSAVFTWAHALGGRLTLSWLEYSPAVSVANLCQGLIQYSPLIVWGGSYMDAENVLLIYFEYSAALSSSSELQSTTDSFGNAGFYPWFYFNTTSGRWVDGQTVDALRDTKNEQRSVIAFIDPGLSTVWAVMAYNASYAANPAASTSLAVCNADGVVVQSSSTGFAGTPSSLSSAADALSSSSAGYLSSSSSVQPVASSSSWYVDDSASSPITDGSLTVAFDVPQPVTFTGTSYIYIRSVLSTSLTAVYTIFCGACLPAQQLNATITPRAVLVNELPAAEWPLFATAAGAWNATGLAAVSLELTITSGDTAGLTVDVAFVGQLGSVTYVAQMAPPQRLAPNARPSLYEAFVQTVNDTQNLSVNVALYTINNSTSSFPLVAWRCCRPTLHSSGIWRLPETLPMTSLSCRANIGVR